ncbi:MAG: hypothetical protein ACUZ8H_03190 [Candidatus Anammoxibacter sp.]
MNFRNYAVRNVLLVIMLLSFVVFPAGSAFTAAFAAPVSADLTPIQDVAVHNFLAEKYGKIDVINQQSYPVVGEYRTTQFVTKAVGINKLYVL